MAKDNIQKTKTIVKKDEKKLIWAGAQRLMQKPETQQKDKERKLILLTAKVLNISPFGVNILGDLPYINKLGLMEKAKQYEPKVEFQYRWIKYSQDDTDKAVCECKLVVDGKDLTDWVTGECSPSTMKMSTLKGYQNHIAQTRARNRAIYEAFGVRTHEEMMKNIEELYQQKAITEKEIEKIGGAITTSAEEVQEEKSVQKGLFAKEAELEDLKKLAREIGAKEGEEKEFIEKVTELVIDWENLTKKQISILKASLLNKRVK